MRAAVYAEPYRIALVERPDPRIVQPTDAIVRVIRSCVCGSDLWYYRGQSPREHGQTIGHEFIGIVEEIGRDVTRLAPSTVVVAPFMWSDGTCAHCRYGVTSACTAGGIWGAPGADGGQGEALRVPFADATLVPVPTPIGEDRYADLLALADVMGTGHHAAVSAGVRPGSTVAVIGDGAVGLCAVIAAHRLGAERIIAMSRTPARSALARRAGATDVLPQRGDDAVAALREATDGVGVDAALECVGTGDAMRTALAAVRPGGAIGYVGVPHGTEFPAQAMFTKNIRVGGGLAPVRTYLPELLDAVLAGQIAPGIVFDAELPLASVSEAYRLMDERAATKVMLRP